MKKIMGILMVLITIIFPTSLKANADSITLINKGESIELTNAIIKSDDDFFISLDDLKSINIEYAKIDEQHLRLGLINSKKYSVYIYIDDKIFDGNNIYENAVLIEDGITYVSLNAIAGEYSDANHTTIERSKNYISLWINDYTTDTYWLTYKVDDNIEINENGLTVDLYYGSSSNTVAIQGTGEKPKPEARFGVNMTTFPSDSDVYHLGHTSVIKQKTYTFTNDNRSYTWSYDVKRRTGGNSGGGASSNGSSVFGFIVDTDKYMGGVQSYYSNSMSATVTLTKADITEFITVSGTVTIPAQENNLGFHVIAEGDSTIERTADGNYLVHRKHVDSSFGVIEVGNTTSSYELKLVPNQDYEIYVRFENGKYVRQTIKYENLVEDKILDFNSFEESKTIKGTIKLPDDITTLSDLSSSSVSAIDGEITLQSDTAPYYIVSKTGFMLDLENRTCDFTLVDDMDLGNGYIYFRLHGLYQEVYPAGVYVSNDKTGYVIDEANVVSSGTEGLVLTLSKGKVIETVIDYTAEKYSEGEHYILIQENNNNALDFDQCDLFVYGDRFETEYDLDNAYCKVRHKAVIPYDKSKYISCLLMYYGNLQYPLYYDTETTTWSDEFSKADILINSSLEAVFEGYKPATAVRIDDGTLYENNLTYCAKFSTIGDFDYLGATRYVAYYGENNQLLHLESALKNYKVRLNSVEDIELDSTYYPLAREIKLFIWHDNLKPIAEVCLIK